jgi:hypothetical protein
MPIGAGPEYPILEDIMLLARSYVNDTFQGATGTQGEGQIFTDGAPFTIPFINAAIRELYRELGNNGVCTLIKDNFILTGLEPVVTVDPSVQVSITFAGYNNGTTTDTGLQLPSDLLAMLEMWERQNGSGNPFTSMVQCQPLPSRNQVTYLGDWEYRSDSIYMVGSTQSVDVRLRYICQLPGQVSGAGTDFASLSVPVQDCQDAIAWKLAAKYAYRLDGASEEMQSAQANAAEAVRQLVNRQVRAKQRVQYIAQPYGESGGWPWGPTTGGYGQ